MPEGRVVILASKFLMKKLLLTTLLITLFRSGFAQSPNGFDIALDKKVKETHTVVCGENGFCLVMEKKTRKIHEMTFVHIDTMMKRQRQETLTLPDDWQFQQAFYEDGTLVIQYHTYHKSRPTDAGTLLLYHPGNPDGKLDTLTVSGIPTNEVTTQWHYHQGNLMFVTLSKHGDRVWFLPAGAEHPVVFPFTQDSPGHVLLTAVDTSQNKAIICFSSGGHTMYFESDFHGQSSFANMIKEPATHAQWIPVGQEHSVLMLTNHDDNVFYMHPVNILNHKVMPSETIYCADILVPQTLPAGVKQKQTIIIVPHSAVNFMPSHYCVDGSRIALVTELYYLEYYNYFNGWYVEPRFNGYRYERADVHFFDTNGVFITNIIFPYGESSSLHTTLLKKLKVCPLQNHQLLMYQHSGLELSTMLVDSACKVVDPVRSAELPLPKIPLKKQSYAVERFVPWYGCDEFLLTAYRLNAASMKKIGYLARKVTYR